MNGSFKCRYTEVMIHQTKAVYVENEQIKVGILAGKGADVFELLHKPTGTDALLRTQRGLDVLKGRDFSVQKACNYAEFYEGGWQDVLPLRALWQDKKICGENAGEAATIAWNFDVLHCCEDKVNIKFWAMLPVLPLYVEKVFTMYSEIPKLFMQETVTNLSDNRINFSWTQHPAFGGTFLESGMEIRIPSETAFDYCNFMLSDKGEQRKYFHLLKSMPTNFGNYCDLSIVPEHSTGLRMFYTIPYLRQGTYHIINEYKRVAVSLDWDLSTFPHLWYWMECCDDFFTVALEPSTTYLPDTHEECNGGMITLESGKSISTWINISIYNV